jgi:hypothetical protein
MGSDLTLDTTVRKETHLLALRLVCGAALVEVRRLREVQP